MSVVVRTYNTTKASKRVAFSREELRQLFAVYSRRVATGEWRDYAIDHGPERAVFSIFRHTAEHPLYAVAKLAPGCGKRGRYLLSRGPEKIKQGATLAEVVAEFDRRPRLVSRII